MKVSFEVGHYSWFLSYKRIINRTEKYLNKILICKSKLRPYIGIREHHQVKRCSSWS